MRTEHTLWQSKYRPRNLENYAATKEVTELFESYVAAQDIPNLFLHGIQGTGKTSAAKMLAELLDADYIYINASDDRSIDTIREKVVGFASVKSLSNLKIIILDEVEAVTFFGQAALKSVMETYDMNVRFILTSNHPDKLLDAIRSRCKEISFTGIEKSKIARILVTILEKEEVEYELDDIKLLVNTHYPDLRKTILDTQSFTKNKKLSVPKNIQASTTDYDSVIDLLVSGADWTKIRQSIADSNIKNFEPLYSYIYKNIDKFPVKKQPNIILSVAEAQYQAGFVIDKEITFMACICNILK